MTGSLGCAAAWAPSVWKNVRAPKDNVQAYIHFFIGNASFFVYTHINNNRIICK
ncbi:hypothetical protein ACSLGF_04755 [Bacillus sp. A015]